MKKQYHEMDYYEKYNLIRPIKEAEKDSMNDILKRAGVDTIRTKLIKKNGKRHILLAFGGKVTVRPDILNMRLKFVSMSWGLEYETTH